MSEKTRKTDVASVARDEEDKVSYDELKNIAFKWKEEAEHWKKKAYEEAGKISRISLLLECLKLECSFTEFGKQCFTERAVQEMSNELVCSLYPLKEDKGNKEDKSETSIPEKVN